MNLTPFDYQAIALKKFYTGLTIERFRKTVVPGDGSSLSVLSDDRPILVKQGGDFITLNTSEEREKERMKDERKNKTRGKDEQDEKRNPADFNPGKKASAPTHNLNEARNDLMNALDSIPDDTTQKGNTETRTNRERMDRNQNLPLDVLNREQIMPVSTKTIVHKSDIINSIDDIMKKRKNKNEKDYK